MKSLLHILASYLAILFFITFIFKEVNLDGVRSGYIYLFMFFFATFPSFISNYKLLLNKKNLALNFYMFAFMIYVLIMLFIDLNDLDKVKQSTIGTTGGFIIYFLIGLFVALNIISIIKLTIKKNKYKKTSFMLSVFVILYFFTLLLESYKTGISNLRSDIFLSDEKGAGYQRLGNLLFISQINISIFFILVKNQVEKIKKTILRYIILTGFLLITFLLALYGQLMGSNTLFASSIIYSLVITPLILLSPRKTTNILNLKFILIFISIALLLYLFHKEVLSIFNIDKYSLRIFGFGTGSYSSFESRIEIFKDNFLLHFSYNPLFGNMAVDEITTGKGTYVHSLISLLTHTGILGAFLFIMHIYRIFKTDNNQSTPLSRLYLLTILVTISLSLASTFFLWIPMWFSLGLFAINTNILSKYLSKNEKPSYISKRIS